MSLPTERYRTLVEEVKDYAIFAMDTEGQIVSWNEDARRTFGYADNNIVGTSGAALFPPEDGGEAAFRAELKQAADLGEAGDDRWLVRAGGQRFWASGATSALRDERSGELIGFAKVVRDATAQRLADDRLAAQYAITVILAGSATLEQATPQILQTLCHHLRFDWGALWVADREGRTIRCIESFCQTPSTSAGAAEFARMSRETELVPGRGLPGRVWLSQEPAWIEDVTRDENFPRAPFAASDGLRGAVAFPLKVEDRTAGVMEFIARDILPPDPALLRMMGTIGGQIGQFIPTEARGGRIVAAGGALSRDARRRAGLRNHNGSHRRRAGMERRREARILVVEDEPDARRLISTVLFQAHAQVTAVASAREALAELRTRNGEFDLILSDIGMPGEDGCDLLTQIRQSEHDAATPRRHILAAALSAMTRDSDRARALACGFDAFFAKPIDPTELITGLSQLLGSPAALQRRGPLS